MVDTDLMNWNKIREEAHEFQFPKRDMVDTDSGEHAGVLTSVKVSIP